MYLLIYQDTGVQEICLTDDKERLGRMVHNLRKRHVDAGGSPDQWPQLFALSEKQYNLTITCNVLEDVEQVPEPAANVA